MKYTPAMPARAHQVEAVAKSIDKYGFGFLMEMGTGKTKAQLDEIGQLQEAGEARHVLLLAPKGVYLNWQNDEIPKHWTEEWRSEQRLGAWRGAGTVAQREEVNGIFANDPALRYFFSMNIEALAASDKAFDVAVEYVRRHRAMVVIDESTVIKNPQAQRTRAANRLRELSSRRRILTGQPVPNGPMDMYSQIDFIDQGRLGSSFYGYRARYAVLKNQVFGTRQVKTIVGYRDLAEVAERILPVTFRKRKDECLDLPPKIYLTPRAVELTDEQRRIYNDIRDNATARIRAEGDDHVTANIVLVQLLRMHQVLCGHVVDEEGQVHRLTSNRPAAMLEETEQMRGCGIVWASYHDDIERIVEALERAYPGRVAELHGRVSQDDYERNKRRFLDGSADWVVGTAAKAGRGLTLTRACNTLYYSNSQNLDHREQSEDRTHRDGQHWPCTYQDLQVPGTMEEKFIKSLRAKKDLAQEVLNDGYRAWVI